MELINKFNFVLGRSIRKSTRIKNDERLLKIWPGWEGVGPIDHRNIILNVKIHHLGIIAQMCHQVMQFALS
jgi:hypothetical protein